MKALHLLAAASLTLAAHSSVVSATPLATAPASAAPATANHYDEIYTEDGHVRPEYQGVLELLLAMTPEQQQAFVGRSYARFNRDNRLDPMPRIIDAREYDQQIVRGVEQRARALVAFLKDHYSGERRYRAIVSEETVLRIIERTGEAGFDGLISPERISFPYGPDIIRDAQGTWRVIEDNPGFIGGPGDLLLARQLMLKSLPQLESVLNPRDPDVFYRQLADNYQTRARANGGKAVFLMSPYVSDNEDKRIRKILRERGVETVFPNAGDLQLVVKPDGVYSYKKSQGPLVLEKVGFVAINGEHAWMDPSHPATWERMVVDTAKEAAAREGASRKMRERLSALLLEPRSPERTNAMYEAIRQFDQKNDLLKALKAAASYRGLTQAILDGRVSSNYAPGVDFIGDKELYVHVEDFVRFYLNEEPVLRNIPTGKFADREGRLDRARLDDVLANMNRYVIKKVDGRGGDAVWVGPKMKLELLPEVRLRVEQDPGSYIYQEYKPISILRSFGQKLIVDMRVIADVFNSFVSVANTAWGRGISVDGDGKVNLSSNGREVTVLVRESQAAPAPRARPMLCRDLFTSRR